MVKEEVRWEIRKYFELNEIIHIEFVEYSSSTVLIEIIALNAYIRKEGLKSVI